MNIPLHNISLSEEEIAPVIEVLRKGELSEGTYTQQLTERAQQMLGMPFAFPTPSCSAALELALLGAGISRDDEVILPSFNFPSAANAILRQGARPVFADIERATLSLDPSDVEKRITNKTRAIIVVHYGPYIADMDALGKMVRSRGILLIEDAAHALGALWRGIPAGAIGDIGCFSFHSTKNLAVGEGGLLCAKDADVAKRIEVIRMHGTNRQAFLRGETDAYRWTAAGGNFILAEPLVALVVGQMHNFGKNIAKRREHAAYLLRALHHLSPTITLPTPQKDVESSWHIFPLLVPAPRRDGFIKTLRAAGIGAAFHFVPLHSSPMGTALGWNMNDLPVTEAVASELVRIPIYPSLSRAELDFIAETITSAVL